MTTPVVPVVPAEQAALAAGIGIGLRAAHHTAVMSTLPRVAWFEVHSENYFAEGGVQIECLSEIRSRYPLSLHGVGLSLGSTDPLDRHHVSRLKRLVRRFEPALVSDHLSWSSVGGRFLNDLLPLPHTEEAIRHVAGRIVQVQDVLGRRILIENVSSYVRFTAQSASRVQAAPLEEWEFIVAVAHESGCGLLLDLNNLFVNAHNHGFDWRDYLAGIPVPLVEEFHLAGHTTVDVQGIRTLIDTHASAVSDPVWEVHRAASRRFGAVPTLIEWDSDLPEFTVLQAEARKADLNRRAAHDLAA